MKQVADLTAADFEQAPIWRYRDPSSREVEPYRNKAGAPLLSLVSTECTTADGSTFPGYAMVTKLWLVGPVVFASGRQISLLRGFDAPTPEDLAEAYAAFGRPAESVFPIQIRPVVSLLRQFMPTAYEGFVYRLPEGRHATVR